MTCPKKNMPSMEKLPNIEVCKHIEGLPRWLSDKESTCQCRRHRFDPWVRKISWRRRKNTLVFLPGKFHGQRSLEGYSSWYCKESDRTEHNAHISVQFSSVAQLCLTLCDPMNRSTPGVPVHHQLPESTQTCVH